MGSRWESIWQFLSVALAVAIFIYESRGAKPEDKIILWVILGSILILIVIFISFQYVKRKFDLIESHSREIRELKKEVSIRKSLEELNYKMGKIEGRKRK